MLSVIKIYPEVAQTTRHVLFKTVFATERYEGEILLDLQSAMTSKAGVDFAMVFTPFIH